MKTFLKSIVTGILLLCLLPCLLLAASLSLPDYYNDTYYAELSAMYARLCQAQGPRLIVIGGSNVAFGLDGEQLESTLAQYGYSYQVCPFGLYAAVGTSAMLDLSANELRQGDLVVLALEPTAETLSSYFGATAFLKCAESDPSLLLKVSSSKQSALLGNAIPFLQERWAIRTSGIPPRPEGVYARTSFNDRCDVIFPRPGNAMPLGYDTASPIDLATLTIEDAFAKQLRDYCQLAAERGAQVVLSFCPVNRLALADASDKAVQAFFDLCNRTIPCPVISDPRCYLLDSGWFYDNNVHLNTPGAVLRTHLLTEDLLAFLGCFHLPAAPELTIPDAIFTAPRNSGDTDAFLFLPVTDHEGTLIGYQAAGLTEAGLTAEELILPSHLDGLPVLSLSADAFHGADHLLQLTLPATIEALPDNAFAGLPGFRRLVLLHTDRLCQIGTHAFDGSASLTIHVPREAYPLYRDGQGCAANPWAEHLGRIVPMP